MTELCKEYLKLGEEVREAETDADYYEGRERTGEVWDVLSGAERNWIVSVTGWVY